MSFDSVVVDGGGFTPLMVSVLPRTGLKNCTNREKRRAELWGRQKKSFKAALHHRSTKPELTMIKSPKIFETFVTVVKELPNSSSGMSRETMFRSKSGVSSVVDTIVARVTRSARATRSARGSASPSYCENETREINSLQESSPFRQQRALKAKRKRESMQLVWEEKSKNAYLQRKSRLYFIYKNKFPINFSTQIK